MKTRRGGHWWIGALMLLGMVLGMPCSLAESPDPLKGVSFEVKFLLDSGKALTGQQPAEALKTEFALEECRAIDVIYLETPDRAFIGDGWVNRIRWKTWKKKPECTFKKRYAVSGTDPSAILDALNRVREDALDVSSDACTTEIDWNYSKMTLSVTWESSGKYGDYQSLSQFNTGDDIDFAAAAMPDEEVDWKSAGWGRKALSRAQKIGPLRLMRAKGTWQGTEVSLDIISVTGDAAPVVELSFTADDYQTASRKRDGLTDCLEKLGVLVKEDSLKTQTILDANLLKAPEDPDFILPNGLKCIEGNSFVGCACRYVWVGDAMAEIQSGAFADCRELRYVRLPSNALTVAGDAFPDDADLVIIGTPGSEADTYANEHGFGFIPE